MRPFWNFELPQPPTERDKVSAFGGAGERTREGNDLYTEMSEAGVIDQKDLSKSKVALVYGQMNEPPGARHAFDCFVSLLLSFPLDNEPRWVEMRQRPS